MGHIVTVQIQMQLAADDLLAFQIDVGEQVVVTAQVIVGQVLVVGSGPGLPLDILAHMVMLAFCLAAAGAVGADLANGNRVTVTQHHFVVCKVINGKVIKGACRNIFQPADDGAVGVVYLHGDTGCTGVILVHSETIGIVDHQVAILLAQLTAFDSGIAGQQQLAGGQKIHAAVFLHGIAGIGSILHFAAGNLTAVELVCAAGIHSRAAVGDTALELTIIHGEGSLCGHVGNASAAAGILAGSVQSAVIEDKLAFVAVNDGNQQAVVGDLLLLVSRNCVQIGNVTSQLTATHRVGDGQSCLGLQSEQTGLMIVVIFRNLLQSLIQHHFLQNLTGNGMAVQVDGLFCSTGTGFPEDRHIGHQVIVTGNRQRIGVVPGVECLFFAGVAGFSLCQTAALALHTDLILGIVHSGGHGLFHIAVGFHQQLAGAFGEHGGPCIVGTGDILIRALVIMEAGGIGQIAGSAVGVAQHKVGAHIIPSLATIDAVITIQVCRCHNEGHLAQLQHRCVTVDCVGSEVGAGGIDGMGHSGGNTGQLGCLDHAVQFVSQQSLAGVRQHLHRNRLCFLPVAHQILIQAGIGYHTGIDLVFILFFGLLDHRHFGHLQNVDQLHLGGSGYIGFYCKTELIVTDGGVHIGGMEMVFAFFMLQTVKRQLCQLFAVQLGGD